MSLGGYEFETIAVELPHEGVALATLNRPEKLNAIDRRMFAELRELCEQLEDDERVRVAVLTGAGRGFCSGADL